MYITIGILLTFIIMLPLSKNSSMYLKGKQGEKQVLKQLKKLPKDYYIINNILVKTSWGTSQIDHIVICSYGIFVIETKNYEGVIRGNTEDKYWIQKIRGKEFSFYNPLWQNGSHIRAIKSLFTANYYVPYYSIIAFSKRGKLRIRKQDNIIYINKLRKVIIKKSESAYLNASQVENIYNILKRENSNNIIRKRNHSKYVKHRQSI